MKWLYKSFDDLNLNELYTLMVLRQEVFVVEQNCPYLDADDKDQNSYHVLGYDNKTLVAYARIVKPGISYSEWAVGRVIVKMSHRNKKLGYDLMQQCHHFLHQLKGSMPPIRLSAQSHLEKFYKNCGYTLTGKAYLEDGIPHIEMLRL